MSNDNNSNSREKVLVQKTSNESKELVYAHEGDSGLDICAVESVKIKPLERKLVSTGLKLQMPKGIEAQIRPKSGLALKHGITLLNSPGTIDSSYRGEIKVIMANLGNEIFEVAAGQKIAQVVFAKVEHPEIEYVKELQKTKRNESGFGSSGLR